MYGIIGLPNNHKGTIGFDYGIQWKRLWLCIFIYIAGVCEPIKNENPVIAADWADISGNNLTELHNN